jgi:hypothetical protein
LRIWVILAVAAFAAACSVDEGHVTIERTHDACSPLALVAAEPTAAQYAGIQAAEKLWAERGAPALGRRSGTTMEVRFQEAAAAFHGLYDDKEAVIYINRGIEHRGVMSIVIAHELGHAMGLHHVDPSERISVMNPGNVTVAPTEADQRALEGLWGPCSGEQAARDD